MVRIRLRRVGAKKQPHYRVVVADQRSPRDGRHIETIGHYNPRTEPETVKIKEDRALYWLSKGAQPSDAVQHMLEKQGTMARLARLKAGESLEALVAEYEAGGAADESAEPVEQSTDVVTETPEEETVEAEPVEQPTDAAAETPEEETVEAEPVEQPTDVAAETPEAEAVEAEPVEQLADVAAETPEAETVEAEPVEQPTDVAAETPEAETVEAEPEASKPVDTVDEAPTDEG